GPRRVGAGEDDLTSPRRGDSALLGDGGRPDPRTRGRRGIAFSTDTRDGGERAQECRPQLVTVPGAGPHGDRTPRADPSLRESGDRGRTGDVQLGKMSVGIEAAHVKRFNGGPERGRERPLSLFITPQGLRPRSNRDLRRSQGATVCRLPGRTGVEAPRPAGPRCA